MSMHVYLCMYVYVCSRKRHGSNRDMRTRALYAYSPGARSTNRALNATWQDPERIPSPSSSRVPARIGGSAIPSARNALRSVDLYTANERVRLSPRMYTLTMIRITNSIHI